jgi:hypothetical protein
MLDKGRFRLVLMVNFNQFSGAFRVENSGTAAEFTDHGLKRDLSALLLTEKEFFCFISCSCKLFAAQGRHRLCSHVRIRTSSGLSSHLAQATCSSSICSLAEEIFKSYRESISRLFYQFKINNSVHSFTLSTASKRRSHLRCTRITCSLQFLR